MAGAAGLAVAAVGLVPIAAYLAPTVPMVTQPVRSPDWFTAVAPRLPAGTVLLVFPVPDQVIESAMAWQATAGFPYAMVGGGGPGGVIERTGAERPGAEAVARASFSFTGQRLRPGRRGGHPPGPGGVGGGRGGAARPAGPARLRPGHLGALHRRLPDRRHRPGAPPAGRLLGVAARRPRPPRRAPGRRPRRWPPARQLGAGGSPTAICARWRRASWPRAERGRLVASPPVTHVGSPVGTHRRDPVRTVLVTVVSALVAGVALVALGGQAVRGARTVDVQLAPHAVHDAAVDDAFYACIDTQAHSLVRPGQTVTLGGTNLADVVTMIKGFGSWVTVADPASDADVTLTLHDGTGRPGHLPRHDRGRHHPRRPTGAPSCAWAPAPRCPARARPRRRRCEHRRRHPRRHLRPRAPPASSRSWPPSGSAGTRCRSPRWPARWPPAWPPPRP